MLRKCRRSMIGTMQIAQGKWELVEARDKAADNRFVYCVKSTGIYCRPSCPSRRPKRENVCFHKDWRAAEKAGFRACKRCRPNGTSLQAAQGKQIAKACRLIETSDAMPSLDALVQGTGLSRFHFHRLFKSVTGLTPKAYASEYRAARMRDALSKGKKVTEAIYDSGFNSSARFYDSATQTLGMPPSSFRRGGKGEEIRFGLGKCTLGHILVAASAKGLCAITLGDEAEVLLNDLQKRFSKAVLIKGGKAFQAWMAQVIGFVDMPGRQLDLPLDIRGTAFQMRVWQALRQIPQGHMLSYGELAAKIGTPDAVRAVASACGANKLAIAIPCHRVVARDGSLSGYRWGLARKKALLAREKK